LPEALPINDEEWAGFRLVLQACERPLFKIVENAGASGEVWIDRVKNAEQFVGCDASTLTLVNMLEAGILDPTKVVRSTLINAVSVSSTLLTTEALIRKPDGSEKTL